MENKHETTPRLNTVQTVFSQDAVTALEGITRWFFDEFDGAEFTDILMNMLSIYAAHCPSDAHEFRKPDYVTLFVSSLLQLKEQLAEVMNDEKPWTWIEINLGYSLPEPPR